MLSPTLALRRAVRDLRVGMLASRVIAKTAIRRLLHGPKHPTWSVQFELTNEVIRAVVDHCAAVLLSPWVDLTARGGTIVAHGPYDYLSAEMLVWGAGNYLGGADPNHPLASAVYADFQGFPPLLVQSGGSEILLGQHLTLVERARAAGVQVSHEIADGMVHVFHAFAGHPSARAAYHSIGEFVRKQAR